MNNLSSNSFLFFFSILFILSLSFAAAAASHEPILPRPLIIEYSPSSTVDLTSNGLHVLSSAADEEDAAEELRLRCDSWRVANEANNLAPWITVPRDCAGYVRDYLIGRAYKYDLEMVADESLRYAKSVMLAGDGKDAWVFDVDETLLSNLPYYADHGFGLEVFNPQEFARWVEQGSAPAIKSSLKLYDEVRVLGFKVILLTGRNEAHRNITVDNLIKAGYSNWDALILRNTEDGKKPATVYKSEKRFLMVSDGYRILGNSGDQWSDLLGSYLSNRSFKLPNPMYYIP